MPEPGIGFWFRLIRKHVRFLILVAFGSAVLALAVGFVLPKTYRARAAILPPHEADPLAMLARAQGILQIESTLPFSAGVTLYDIYMGILRSDRVARSLDARFDLREHYRQSTELRTLQKLRRNTTVRPTDHGILEILVEDKDPEFAANLAAAYLEELDAAYRETRSTAASRQRRFLEERVVEATATLDSLEQELVAVQTEGIGILSRDAAEAALAAGELMGERLALGVRLRMLEDLEVEAGPLRRSLEAEMEAMDAQIARLPDVGLELARALRDVRIQETLRAALASQLERVRLEEVRDTPTVEVLDHPVAPDRHVRPRKGLMAMAGFVAGFGLALAWLVFYDPGAGRSVPGSA